MLGARGILGVTLIWALFATAREAEGAPVPWAGNGHIYDVVPMAQGINWEDAEAACALVGGHLATLTSQEENDFVFGLVSALGAQAWLGGLQPPGSSEPDGGWGWVTSEAFSFKNWHGGEPNDGYGYGIVQEDRIMFFTLGSVVERDWNDVPAATLLGAYVVEWEGMPTPSSPTSWGALKSRFR
jgi:hypothetical protein